MEYIRYLDWVKTDDIPEPIDEQNPKCIETLYTHYHFWNQKSGQSRGLIQNPLHKGRDGTRARKPLIPWKVALDSMRSGYNVGSIIRNSEAFGWSEVILGGYSPGPTHSAVQSAAMGTENWIKLTLAPDLEQLLKKAKKSGNEEIIGLELSETAVDFTEAAFPRSGILVLGNEERGISPSVLKCCFRLVKIPLYGMKFSLNVASAFAIAAHGLRRQIHLRRNLKF